MRPGREASLQQVVLAVEIVLRLDQLAARGVERRLRRTQRVQFILRIELRQHLIRLDVIADIGRPFDDPPADAEGQRRLVFRLICPVNTTNSPSSLFSAVTVRTGRAWADFLFLFPAHNPQEIQRTPTRITLNEAIRVLRFFEMMRGATKRFLLGFYNGLRSL